MFNLLAQFAPVRSRLRRRSIRARRVCGQSPQEFARPVIQTQPFFVARREQAKGNFQSAVEKCDKLGTMGIVRRPSCRLIAGDNAGRWAERVIAIASNAIEVGETTTGPNGVNMPWPGPRATRSSANFARGSNGRGSAIGLRRCRRVQQKVSLPIPRRPGSLATTQRKAATERK